MADQTRYFIIRPTDDTGDPVPVEESPPEFYRLANERSYFWSVDRWELSLLPMWPDTLNDLLAGGATVREVLNTAELPEGARRG